VLTDHALAWPGTLARGVVSNACRWGSAARRDVGILYGINVNRDTKCVFGESPAACRGSAVERTRVVGCHRPGIVAIKCGDKLHPSNGVSVSIELGENAKDVVCDRSHHNHLPASSSSAKITVGICRSANVSRDGQPAEACQDLPCIARHVALGIGVA